MNVEKTESFALSKAENSQITGEIVIDSCLLNWSIKYEVSCNATFNPNFDRQPEKWTIAFLIKKSPYANDGTDDLH